MAKVIFEQPHIDTNEKLFAESIQLLMDTSVYQDCRNSAPMIRNLAEKHKVDMVIGSGGSHVYIHRKDQFIDCKNNDLNNVRWAIIIE